MTKIYNYSKNLISFGLVFLLGNILFTAQLFAAGTQTCVTGPYGIRICNTGIIFTGVESNVPDFIFTLTIFAMIVGIIMLVNGKLLKKAAK